MNFRKKPVVIQAEQYTAYGRYVRGMCNSMSCYTAVTNEPHVHTIHDGQIVKLEVGDWIIPEPDGEHFYPCKPDIFAATYDPVHTQMTEVTLLVRVTINDAQLDKINTKRQRLGKQTRTGVEEVMNHLGESLQHNLMFEQPVEIHNVSGNEY